MTTASNYYLKEFFKKRLPLSVGSFVARFFANELKKKIKKDISLTGRKIRVCFLVSASSKWNFGILFDKMLKSEIFEPFVVFAPQNLPALKEQGLVIENYDFFAQRYDDVKWGYDIETDKYIDLKTFKPDIVFYQQYWDLPKIHSIKKVLRYALTCYFPYPIAESTAILDGKAIVFHCFLWKHYISHNLVKNHYNKRLKSGQQNLFVSGHPKLDVYFENEKPEGKNYVIYAPHHSFTDSILKWSTFEWSGKHILEYAKNHPEINWIYKPHPDLIYNVVRNNIMSKEEYEKYVDKWREIGTVYLEGDYFNLFKDSKCLITCCGSFLVEYFPTLKPVIHLKTVCGKEHSALNSAIMQSYYSAYSATELDNHLHSILGENNDYMYPKRKETLDKLELFKTMASDNIIKDLKKELKN